MSKSSFENGSGWRFTLIGGPTLLIEGFGLRLITDPTFDAAGGNYPSGPLVLHKVNAAAIGPNAIGDIDVVLLSHDQHPDNLDQSGAAFLPSAKQVLTTNDGAERLGANAVGLLPGASTQLAGANGEIVLVTATPARHGPEGIEAVTGQVIGFVLEPQGVQGANVYVSGDTVWYEGIAGIGQQTKIDIAVLFLGAVQIDLLGPAHLTMTANEAVELTRQWNVPFVLPIHIEGWAHFKEPLEQVTETFRAADLSDRLIALEPGQSFELPK